MLVGSASSVPWTAFRKFAWWAPSDCWGRFASDCSFLCLFLSTHDFIEVVRIPNQFLLISAYGKIEDGMEIKIMLKNVRRIYGSSST